MAKNKTSDNTTADNGNMAQTESNFVLTYRRDHPLNRCSYGIPGNAGIVVFQKELFADGVPPATITLDVAMALPKADAKVDKAAAQAAKALERAAKLQARIDAQQAKAAERQAKAEAALAAAKAKLEAASVTIEEVAVTA